MKKAYLLIVKIVLGLFLMSLTSCPDIGDPTGDSAIKIVNHSDKTIAFYVDTSRVLDRNRSIKNTKNYIKPNNSHKDHFWWIKWFNQYGYAYIFFFDKNVLTTV